MACVDMCGVVVCLPIKNAHKPGRQAADPPVRVSVRHALTLCPLPSLQVWGDPGPACIALLGTGGFQNFLLRGEDVM